MEEFLDGKSEPSSNRNLETLSRITENDDESPNSKLSGWMDVQSPSENNVPKPKWIEYFESIESHANVCDVDFETGEI